MVLGASLLDVSILEAVVALGEPVGGDDGGDSPGVGEEANRGSQGDSVLWLDGDGNSGCTLASAGVWVGVEETCCEDINSTGIADRCSQGVVELISVVREIWDREGVDGEVGLIRGETKAEPRGRPHQE